MKRSRAFSMLLAATLLASLAPAEDEPGLSGRRTYVLVHGAWGGGWAWRDVADRLRVRGHEAYRPTLTGLGERRHLVAKDVGLDTHIEDVVNLLVFEQLHDVVLVGHSYGGMVISGVADRVPERIAHRIYIDAFVPEDGESLVGEGGPDEWLRNQTRDGLVIPPWVRPDQRPPHDVPHPLRSFTDRVRLGNEAAKRIPTTYILTMDPGAETDDFSEHAARARARGWAFEQLEADHNPQWSKPAELTDLLDAAPKAAETEARAQPDGQPPGEVTEYHGGWVFTGDRFVETSLCVAGSTLVSCDEARGPRVDLEGGFVIPPLADAHTHHFDGPYTIPWQRSAYLEAGIFYALNLTAPTRGVLEIRDRLLGPKNVDVATSMGGITGPDSHPAEIYEALALGIRGYEEQVARAAEIQASRKAADNAYYVVETAADVDEKWALILENDPDIVKAYLRSSERYDEGYGKWGPGGGIDPKLLPRIRQLASEAGLRLAVANSSVADFRASLAGRADLVTHLPCYQDSMSDPSSPYYAVDTPLQCLLEDADAQAAAAIGMGAVLIVSEWAKDRPQVYVEWEELNLEHLDAAGAPLAIGSNAYGSTVVDGLVAGAEKGLFPPVRLLRLATRDTARLIFPERELGCLEPGCEASFLVLDGDPLEDFSRLRAIRLRVKDGEPLTLEEIAGS